MRQAFSPHYESTGLNPGLRGLRWAGMIRAVGPGIRAPNSELRKLSRARAFASRSFRGTQSVRFARNSPGGGRWIRRCGRVAREASADSGRRLRRKIGLVWAPVTFEGGSKLSKLRALPRSPSYGGTGQTLREVGRHSINQRAGICYDCALKPELISAQTLSLGVWDSAPAGLRVDARQGGVSLLFWRYGRDCRPGSAAGHH